MGSIIHWVLAILIGGVVGAYALAMVGWIGAMIVSFIWHGFKIAREPKDPNHVPGYYEHGGYHDGAA